MISQEKKFIDINHYWLNIYKNYEDSLIKLSLSNSTIDWRLKHIRGFLKDLSKKNIYCKELKPAMVYDYLSKLNKNSHRTREHRAMCIRFFINYLFQNKKIKFNGNDILNKIHCNKNQRIFSYYSNEEIRAIINQCDNKTYTEKLDYAIMSLFVYYGLRENDVINLKINSIDWAKNTIDIIQTKTNVINRLVLINETKYPLIDYIKNARKNIDNEYLFIKEDGNRINSHYTYKMLNKYISKAKININGRKHGTHSLRHSIATSMINNDDSIYVISKVLGHSNINDTKVYSKLDENKLKKISLEVPKWKI